jgi:hypothetical protein
MENQSELCYHLFRRRGVISSMAILYVVSSLPVLRSDFLKQFRQKNSNVNAYFRVKGTLEKYNLIEWSLNGDNDYCIQLTDKGKRIYALILEINRIFRICP